METENSEIENNEVENSEIENKHHKKRIIIPLIIVGAIVAFLILPFISWLITDESITATSDAQFCVSCHSMEPFEKAHEADVHGGQNDHGSLPGRTGNRGVSRFAIWRSRSHRVHF